MRPLADRFDDKVCPEPNTGCLLWSGAVDGGGYGMLTVRGGKARYVKAHRLAWETAHGTIPDGQLVCHKCDTPSCVNPEHLFLGTKKDNHDDMANKGRRASFRGELAGSHKLTEDDVREIRRARACGTKLAVLAKAYGVTEANISYIARRKSWAHLG